MTIQGHMNQLSNLATTAGDNMTTALNAKNAASDAFDDAELAPDNLAELQSCLATATAAQTSAGSAMTAA